MNDPNDDVVSMLTDILLKYQEHGQDLPLLCGFLSPDGEAWFAYHFCGYNDLRRLAEAISDEALLRMIARNQDRIDKFIEENKELDS